MDVAKALPRVPAGNLGWVTREEFGRVWAQWEARSAAGGQMDYYLVGVVRTLRWLAEVSGETPVSGARGYWITPEDRDRESFAARAAARSTVLHESRVNIARGTVATLGWMYERQPEPYSDTSASTRSSASTRA